VITEDDLFKQHLQGTDAIKIGPQAHDFPKKVKPKPKRLSFLGKNSPGLIFAFGQIYG